MAVNDKISKTDYNTIRDKIANILGTGSATRGYGQVLQSSQVTESNKVTVNEYVNLQYDIINTHLHQYNTVPTLPTPSEGNTIKYHLTDQPVEYWLSVANTLDANRLTLPPLGRYKTTNFGTSNYNAGNWGRYSSSDELVFYFTVTFTTAEKARHFFNSGSQIEITSSRTGGTSSSQNNTWSSTLTTAAAQVFSGAYPGTGDSPTDGLNYFRCAGSYVSPWYTRTNSSPYGANVYRIYARTPGVTSNSAGTAPTVEFKVSFYDGYVDPDDAVPSGPGQRTAPDDLVNGTFSVSIRTIEATGTMQPPSAGTFTVETPSITFDSWSLV